MNNVFEINIAASGLERHNLQAVGKKTQIKNFLRTAKE